MKKITLAFVLLFLGLTVTSNAQQRYSYSEIYPFGSLHIKGAGDTVVGTQSSSIEKGFNLGLGFRHMFPSSSGSKFAIAIEPQYNSFTTVGENSREYEFTDFKVPLMFQLVNANRPSFGLFPFFGSIGVGVYGSDLSSTEPDFGSSLDSIDYGLALGLEIGLVFFDLKFNYYTSLKPDDSENPDLYKTSTLTVGFMVPFEL